MRRDKTSDNRNGQHEDGLIVEFVIEAGPWVVYPIPVGDETRRSFSSFLEAATFVKLVSGSENPRIVVPDSDRNGRSSISFGDSDAVMISHAAKLARYYEALGMHPDDIPAVLSFIVFNAAESAIRAKP